MWIVLLAKGSGVLAVYNFFYFLTVLTSYVWFTFSGYHFYHINSLSPLSISNRPFPQFHIHWLIESRHFKQQTTSYPIPKIPQPIIPPNPTCLNPSLPFFTTITQIAHIIFYRAMYNGIGLQTARGPGTLGYVQKTLASRSRSSKARTTFSRNSRKKEYFFWYLRKQRSSSWKAN